MTIFRYLSLLIVMTCLCLLTTACGEDASSASTSENAASPTLSFKPIGPLGDQPLTADKHTRLVSLDVTGMHCGGCAMGIADAVYDMPGVTEISIDHVNGKAWVLVDKTSRTDSQILVAKINELAGGQLYQATLTTP